MGRNWDGMRGSLLELRGDVDVDVIICGVVGWGVEVLEDDDSAGLCLGVVLVL